MEAEVAMSKLLEPASLSETGHVSRAAERTDPHSSSQETHVRQSGTASVTISQEDEDSSTICPTGWLSALKARAPHLAVFSLALNGIFIIILITLSAKPCELGPAGAACPDGWLGYLRKCYYFSEAEANWTDSQNNCSALGASLAVIDTKQEMDFLMRYKGHSDYWIGLRREPDQPWKWANGIEFKNGFSILGGEQCAFLIQDNIASSSCSREGPWICSKPEQEPEGQAKGLSLG
ncbi:C-type lectin domain family 2 member B-like [Carettochelys insculpta]|uniref:C-type lectin domain family 2 member B-like n=1 Tax=Carettochelys insculpta TaxID=44489 RepID=UPI003EBA4251